MLTVVNTIPFVNYSLHLWLFYFALTPKFSRPQSYAPFVAKWSGSDCHKRRVALWVGLKRLVSCLIFITTPLI